MCLYDNLKYDIVLYLYTLDNFDQNSDDEITLKGFLDLHLMTAQDTSGGKEAELLNILQAMGYNSQLKLDEVCE